MARFCACACFPGVSSYKTKSSPEENVIYNEKISRFLYFSSLEQRYVLLERSTRKNNVGKQHIKGCIKDMKGKLEDKTRVFLDKEYPLRWCSMLLGVLVFPWGPQQARPRQAGSPLSLSIAAHSYRVCTSTYISAGTQCYLVPTASWDPEPHRPRGANTRT